MSSEKPVARDAQAEEDEPAQGPNLVALYSFLGLALLIALGIAAFIILPFYQHRH